MNEVFGGSELRELHETPGMNCLRSLEHWDRGFESHSMRLFYVCVVLYR
jgi:hypothetical protein